MSITVAMIIKQSISIIHDCWWGEDPLCWTKWNCYPSLRGMNSREKLGMAKNRRYLIHNSTKEVTKDQFKRNEGTKSCELWSLNRAWLRLTPTSAETETVYDSCLRPHIPYIISSHPSSHVLESRAPVHTSQCPHSHVPVPFSYTARPQLKKLHLKRQWPIFLC